MGFAEALSDDGSLTGRGHPWVRGFICGLMTALGGIGHTLPFLIADFREAMTAAVLVVVIELGIISWVRHRYMETPRSFGSSASRIGRNPGLRYRRLDRQCVMSPCRHVPTLRLRFIGSSFLIILQAPRSQ